VEILAVVGVPEIAPVELFKLKPAGSAGVIEKVLVPNPPEVVTGVKVVAATPEVSEVALIGVDADNGVLGVGATCADWVVIDPLAVEVLDVPIAFVALTVKV
jgi:hypothetical protein